MIRRVVALLALLSLLIVPVPKKAQAQDLGNEEDWLQLARSTPGPILWHISDPELRQRMENDLELMRLWNEAESAKRKRKSLGMALFTPGAILMGLGIGAALFQNAMGFYDEDTGDYIMIAGLGIGVGLVVPGVYFTLHRSTAERTYEKYMQDTYGVKPIMQLNPARNEFLAGLRLTF